MSSHRLLVVGASGAIGAAVVFQARERSWDVTECVRSPRPGSGSICYDLAAGGFEALAELAPFDAVCWAQGANLADSPATFDVARHQELYNANVLTVAHGLSQLVTAGALAASGARLCVVSSIWQEIARQDRLSYSITKAAVGGLVRAASADLASAGHLINAVLPGVIDTPMARRALSAEQIERVGDMTGTGRLADMGGLTAAILFVLSPENTSITGQSLPVDLGFTTQRRF